MSKNTNPVVVGAAVSFGITVLCGLIQTVATVLMAKSQEAQMEAQSEAQANEFDNMIRDTVRDEMLRCLDQTEVNENGTVFTDF